MAITDPAKAEACLARIGYYRLSAYWHPFRQQREVTDARTSEVLSLTLDEYREGTDFATIHDLYVFDKKMRLIVLDALERVEIAVRTDIALLLGAISPLAYRDASKLHGNFARRVRPGETSTKHADWLQKLDFKFLKSREVFAQHFKKNYPGDHLPIWMSVELWDFGALSHLFNGLNVVDRDTIAARYDLPPGYMQTWLRCLNDVRNTCAHHSRLWNKTLVNQPGWPPVGTIPDLDHITNVTKSQTRLYAALLILRHLTSKINPTSSWSQRVADHVRQLPPNDAMPLESAGFPQNWETQPGWA